MCTCVKTPRSLYKLFPENGKPNSYLSENAGSSARISSLDRESELWNPPPPSPGLVDLVRSINRAYRNRRSIHDYYAIGNLLHHLCDLHDSENGFETYFKSADCQVAFKWNSSKCYREFANFIGEFPRFQFSSFDLTDWRRVKLDYVPGFKIQIVVGYYLPITSLEIFGYTLKFLTLKLSLFPNQL